MRSTRQWELGLAVVLAAAALVAACSTAPIGISPALKGTYWQNALVTNPNGGGPQVVRFGPPQNYNPEAPD